MKLIIILNRINKKTNLISINHILENRDLFALI